jgi:RHS repeat-associated protein
MVLSNDSQQVVWQADYHPFGKVLESVTTISNNVRFPGRYFDRESGLNYNYFRE